MGRRGIGRTIINIHLPANERKEDESGGVRPSFEGKIGGKTREGRGSRRGRGGKVP